MTMLMLPKCSSSLQEPCWFTAGLPKSETFGAPLEMLIGMEPREKNQCLM
jgi:hypothetical protein